MDTKSLKKGVIWTAGLGAGLTGVAIFNQHPAHFSRSEFAIGGVAAFVVSAGLFLLSKKIGT